MKKLKIAYIGGGSKLWARSFMYDLALTEELEGEVCLYDIDVPSAKRNQQIGIRIQQHPHTKSHFNYTVSETLEDCLKGADFVLISILPATFEEMKSDVHAPEAYGIYQAVGDTVGPGGILRAMRTVPMYWGFARAIQSVCPNAWVISLTNPMSICVKALYDVFPTIKAFGCCHEVFHAQEFLCVVLKEMKGIHVHRKDIFTDAGGINHFTWITEAKYQSIDILKLLPDFISKFYDCGYYEYGDPFQYKTNVFAYGNKVKMDLFLQHGVLPAAGDRHLVEFMNNHWYLASPEMVIDWQYQLTPVEWRVQNQKEKIEESIRLASGEQAIDLQPSGEEIMDIIKALLGFGTLVSNVNLPNHGQVEGLPYGSIVETNCVFHHDAVRPIVSKQLPASVLSLVYRNCANIDLCYQGIKEENLDMIFHSFLQQPLCAQLRYEEAKALFKTMLKNTYSYLEPHFHNLDLYLL